MKRAEGLVEFSRRGFGAACLGIAVGACIDSDRRAIGTGGLGTENGTPVDGPGGGSGSGSDSVDANPTQPVDAATTAGPTCTSVATDVGAASSYALDTPKYNATTRKFVVKDAGGFYAVSALCTHEGAITAVSGTRFRCPRHGELFTFDGAFISGPTPRPLAHYAMCVLANGNLGVTTTTVAAATRMVV